MTTTRGKEDSLTPAKMRARLLQERDAGNTRLGGDGERIFAECLRDLGHSVASVHGHGFDLLVDGVLSVDVKTHLALGRKRRSAPRQVPLKQRTVGVHYSYVEFDDDAVRLYDCPTEPQNKGQIELSWAEACAFLSRAPRKTRRLTPDPVGVRAAQRRQCAELREWIKTNWGLKAKINFRGNPIAQDSMAARGWGPESFYQDPAKYADKVDLVLLVYFDGPEPGAVLAYPLSHSAAIKWTQKPVGPNPTGRKTFDPSALQPRFAFTDMRCFKREFPQRFRVKK
jgi:hypothetical protein